MNIDVGDALRSARGEALRQQQQQDHGVPKRERPYVPQRHQVPPHEPEGNGTLALVAHTAWRVSLPAVGLFALLALVHLYRAEPTTLLEGLFAGSGGWLTLGALCIPLTYLAVHLASRRYGSTIALAQVVSAWVMVAVAALIVPVEPSFELGGAGSARHGWALVASLVVSQLVAIVAFDATRSRSWWKAPLHGFLWACLAFAITFYAAAYLGSEGPWFSHMTEYFAASLIVSALLLVPYWIARPLIKPLHGLAGY